MFMLFSLTLLSIVLQTSGQDPVWITWKDSAPSSIPFEKSTDIIGWQYLNDSNYIYGGPSFLSADTWFPAWSLNNNLYSPWTDGTVTTSSGKNVTSGSGGKPKHDDNSTTGYAIITGDNVSNLTIVTADIFTSSSYPYQGRYPCGSFIYNQTWFYGTYFVNNENNGCGNWCQLGPFVGFRWSFDYGTNWIEPRLKCKDHKDNIFHETVENNEKIKFGAPHIIDFGQELKYSPDGKMYIIGHGAQRKEATQSWMQGDQVYVARVEPTVQAINDSNSWEFYVGNNEWKKGNVSIAQPLFTWNDKTGVVTMTYFNVLKKYIMAISTPTVGNSTIGPFDTYFLESDNIVGPFKYIVYMKMFGPEAYFVNHPSKFLSDNIENNEYYPSYLSYSANFAMDHGQNDGVPIGSGYHWSLQQARFKLSQNFVKLIRTPEHY